MFCIFLHLSVFLFGIIIIIINNIIIIVLLSVIVVYNYHHNWFSFLAACRCFELCVYMLFHCDK